MRILQVIEFLSPGMGGSATVVYQISKHLAASGHEVWVLTSDYSPDGVQFPDEKFNIQIFKTKIALSGVYITPGIIPWIKQNLFSFDVVHLHNLRTFQNLLIDVFTMTKKPTLFLSAHGSLPLHSPKVAAKKIFDWLCTRRLLRKVNCVLAVSPIEVTQYLNAGISYNRICMVYNGLNMDEFKTMSPPGQFRLQLGIPDNALIILYLGRIHSIKGIDHLISAFAQLRKSRMDLRLIIAGPDDGDLKRLMLLSQQTGLSSYIYFPGGLYGDQKLSALADADVVVLPSSYEIFGLTAFEALACGTPVVVSANSGSGQLISQAGAGYLISHGDIQQLASTIGQALNNQLLSKNKVLAGQAFIRANLQWPVLVRQIESIYTNHLSPSAISHNKAQK